MLNYLITPKEQIFTINESTSAQEAVDLLEDYNLRNAPVVSGTGNLYRGNIYRYHIYQHKFHHPDDDLSTISVTHFLKNTTKVIHQSDSIYQVFFAIKDLPFIAVLNEQNSFVGILRQETLLKYFSQAWSTDKVGYILTIKARGVKGEFRKLSRLINSYSDISMVTSFEKTEFGTDSFLMVCIPSYIDQATVYGLVRNLNRRKYEVDFAII